MLQQFSLRPDNLPALQRVQNFVCYYCRTKLGGSDTSANIGAAVRAQEFSGREDEHQPFTFGWDRNDMGQLAVGNGSDERPFLVGFSSKALLRQADRVASTFIFHVDTTYKTNQVGYPVLVCGITDATRKFHLLALFVSSQQQEAHYAKAFAALRWVYSQVVGKPLTVAFVMGDADGAQYNALRSVFGEDCDYVHLMCFYHLIAKVVDRTKGLPKAVGDAVLEDVYNMHYSRSSEEFTSLLAGAQRRWHANADLRPFRAYFSRVWLNERFSRWQCFRTPGGFATTNNPVEQFNRALKRDYTVHRLLKMGELMHQLAACCRQRAIDVAAFATEPAPSKEILARVTALRLQHRLRADIFERICFECMLQLQFCRSDSFFLAA